MPIMQPPAIAACLKRVCPVGAALILACVSAASAEELRAPDPMARSTDNLRKLSSFVDQHRSSVDRVNRSASTAAGTGSNASSQNGFVALRQFGATPAIESFLRNKGFESVGEKSQIEFLQTHENQLDNFAQTLRQVQTDIVALPPAEAKQRLDAIMVSPDLQQILKLGSDGIALPDPPHLQRPASGGGTSLTTFVAGPGLAATVEYPSVVEVAYAWPGHGSTARCTGTLVSADAVLTAAHCFCDFANVTTAAACNAAHYMRGLESVKPTDERFISIFFQDMGALPVKQIIINPDYDLPKKDLAVVKLASAVQGIMPAPLNTARPLRPGEFAHIVGFGAHTPLDTNGHPEPGPPIRNSEGLKLWATVLTDACNGGPKFEESICWTFKPRNEDTIFGTTCHGDSGGPAFATIDGAVKLVGVTSGGPDDCSSTSVQSFDVDVQKNLNWITSVAGPNVSPDFSANPDAFVNNPANRAYGAEYHLFVNQPDQSTASFFVPPAVSLMRLSVNTTPTFASLSISAFAPGSATAACSVTGVDAFATCNVASPATGNWTVRVTGSKPQESQVVAAVKR